MMCTFRKTIASTMVLVLTVTVSTLLWTSSSFAQKHEKVAVVQPGDRIMAQNQVTDTVEIVLSPVMTDTDVELTELPDEELPEEITELMTQPLTDAMPLPEMAAVQEELLQFEAPPLAQVSARIARQAPLAQDAATALLAERNQSIQPLSVADISHQLIPGPNGSILARVYTPAGDGPFPVIVYYHGGGWVFAGLETYDPSMRALANAANAIVVGVAYRQAPEHRFPAAVEDAYTAYQYVLENADQFNGDPERVAVVGESAGGNLAAVVSLLARDRGEVLPVHQVLIYPVTQQISTSTPSYETYADAVPLNRPLMIWFLQRYLPNTEAAFNPYVSPLLAEDLSGLPSATVITAEIDPLRSEGEAYAMRLEEAGVGVTYENFAGVTHEFFGLVELLAESQAAVNLAAEERAAAFGDDTAATPIEDFLDVVVFTDTVALTDTTALTDTAEPTDTAELTDTQDITDTADDSLFAVISEIPELSELTALIEAAQLELELSQGGPFTLFAPTNDALAALPEDTLETLQTDLSVLADLLQHHLVADVVTATDLAQLGTALMLTGDTVDIETADDGTVTVSGEPVIAANIEASNGIIHIIDGVLLPPGQ